MKLVFAIVNTDEEDAIIESLVANNFRTTKLRTCGGFLRETNTTLMCALEDHRVDSFVECMKGQCHCRTKMVYMGPDKAQDQIKEEEKTLVDIGGATILVLNVERYLKM
ncbi:MAG: cyclic-di-AMP receptor [Clostridia bacterium]|nr:cyclic-di-AMP receptor [Clostridia bacterium]